MWISRSEYERLLKRIEDLESKSEDLLIWYGREMYLTGLSSISCWRAGRDHNVLGNKIPIGQLVARIAEYLGFEMIEPSPGGLVDPPRPWVDIAAPAVPAQTIRVRKRREP